ncbi:hypothetical protein GWE18_20100 [Bradyrhizobium sp. CSA112]|uniref:hypothetical protein n=1 Tax=Bradyrhizobium sp. CSA112 TaxID=2699170 RepID=UPI0023B0FF33|nr:hypothetical protein [Bradyrhizobium sp. CSA112]MDE5455104.1 hypothetical protein [Bradyrhizobium sp. CSA112]
MFGKLLFDFSPEGFGEDSSRTGVPEAMVHAPIRFDIGDLSREIAAYDPIALVNNSGTQRLQCAACFDAGELARAVARGLPISGAVDLYFHRIAPLTRV